MKVQQARLRGLRMRVVHGLFTMLLLASFWQITVTAFADSLSTASSASQSIGMSSISTKAIETVWKSDRVAERMGKLVLREKEWDAVADKIQDFKGPEWDAFQRAEQSIFGD